LTTKLANNDFFQYSFFKYLSE